MARFGTSEIANCLTVALDETLEIDVEQYGTVPGGARYPPWRVVTDDDLGIGDVSSSLSLQFSVPSDGVVLAYSVVFTAVQVGNRGVIVFHALSSDGDIELDADLTDAGLNAVVDALG